MEVLQREGFTVKKDNRGRRRYTDNDIMVIEKLIELSKIFIGMHRSCKVF